MESNSAVFPKKQIRNRQQLLAYQIYLYLQLSKHVPALIWSSLSHFLYLHFLPATGCYVASYCIFVDTADCRPGVPPELPHDGLRSYLRLFIQHEISRASR
jgi:hypothetical protein